MHTSFDLATADEQVTASPHGRGKEEGGVQRTNTCKETKTKVSEVFTVTYRDPGGYVSLYAYREHSPTSVSVYALYDTERRIAPHC